MNQQRRWQSLGVSRQACREEVHFKACEIVVFIAQIH